MSALVGRWLSLAHDVGAHVPSPGGLPRPPAESNSPCPAPPPHPEFLGSSHIWPPVGVLALGDGSPRTGPHSPALFSALTPWCTQQRQVAATR